MSARDHSVDSPRTSAGTPAPAGARGPGGPFDDHVDYARTESELKHRLFGTPRVATKLGRFEVVGSAGAGEMGRVYIAYDPELDRNVAIKVVRNVGLDPTQASLRRARLAREARALAKVSDRNVIGVYEVGHRDDELFIVMEYVSGPNLRSWLAAQSRNPEQIARVLVGAASGLAAAHRAGLVHRDFKPENVVVDEGARAVVLDFGLARSAQASSTDDTAGPKPSADGLVTRTGARAGTPAYMAPEQLDGDPPSPRSDQFSFCVVAWEALTGERPFEDFSGNGMPARRRTPQPNGAIRVALQRGLALDAADRWPSVQALVAALQRAHTRSRRRKLWIGLGALGLVGATALARERYAHARAVDACEAEGATIAKTWNDVAREEVRAGLLATDVSYAAATAEHVLPILDARAAAWQRARTQACLSTDVHSTWDRGTREQSDWCLDDQRLRLDALSEALAHANSTTVRKAAEAANALPTTDACTDPLVLSRMPAPPQQRDELTALRRTLARAAALAASGEYEPGLQHAQRAVEAAELLGWPPLHAAARRQEGSLLDKTGDPRAAEVALSAAYFEAVRAADHSVALDAANALVFTVGHSLARHDDGALWAQHAQTHLDTLGEPEQGLRRATTLSQLAVVRQDAGKHEEAKNLSERALEIRRAVLGPDHLTVATSVGTLATSHASLGDAAQARELHQRALEIKRNALGDTHPSVARSLNNLAGVVEAAGDLDEAGVLRRSAVALLEKAHGGKHPAVAAALANLANLMRRQGEHELAQTYQRRALTILETALGPEHPNVGITLANHAGMLKETGALEEAKDTYARAIPILESSLGAEHPNVARFLSNEAGVHMALGSPQDAKLRLERALSILEASLGPDHPELANTYNNLGSVLEATGDLDQAQAQYARALQIREAVLGPDSPAVASPLTNLAALAVTRDRPAAAVAPAQRALRILEAAGAPPQALAQTQFVLARALWSTPDGNERNRARALARLASDASHGAPKAEVDAWLSAHGEP